jgi:preprotein translocase subunit SecE
VAEYRDLGGRWTAFAMVLAAAALTLLLIVAIDWVPHN